MALNYFCCSSSFTFRDSDTLHYYSLHSCPIPFSAKGSVRGQLGGMMRESLPRIPPLIRRKSRTHSVPITSMKIRRDINELEDTTPHRPTMLQVPLHKQHIITWKATYRLENEHASPGMSSNPLASRCRWRHHGD